MNASPVCSAAFVQTDAGAYVADLMKEIPAGEYLMELSGPGAVLRYACENQSIVYTSDADAPTLDAAPKMQVIFSATADPFFGAASGSASDQPANDPFIRAENEDDDGYDPYSDRPPAPEPLFQENPWD